MKRYLIFIFVLFYFSAASGATMEFHYCMGNLVEWGMAHSEEESKTCSNCKMSAEGSEDCCKKDQQEVKIEKAQKAQFNFQFKSSASDILTPFVSDRSVITFESVHTGYKYNHDPPRTEKTPVFVLLRTFRI